MSELDFSGLVDALRTPQPRDPAPSIAPVETRAPVGAGAYRTAHIVVDVMPLPRPPWWVRAQAVVLHMLVGRSRASTRQWYRRTMGGRWAQVLNRDGDATWLPVPVCPATFNAYLHPAGAPAGAPAGVCFDDDALFHNGALVTCHCERWP